MDTIKGIRIEIGRNSYLVRLLRSYRQGKNLFLNYLKDDNRTSLSAVNSYRKLVIAETGLSGANSNQCSKDALAIYRRFRKGKKNRFPTARSLSMSVQLGYNGKMKRDQLRITFSRNKYIYLDLKLGDYHRNIFSLEKQGLLKFGEIIVKKDYCIFTIKKEYTPYIPEGVLALDINERHIVGLAMNGQSTEIKACGNACIRDGTKTETTERTHTYTI